MYLLDTNIISLFDPRRMKQERALIAKLRAVDDRSFISVLTLAEIEAGILKLRREAKHQRADQLAVFRDGLINNWAERLLPITASIALAMPHIAEQARPSVVERIDVMIAATAAIHGLTVLTRNGRHFEPTGVAWLDPADLP